MDNLPPAANAIGREDGTMDNSYWDLFWATGRPVFYLLHRWAEDAARAKTAWGENQAAEV